MRKVVLLALAASALSVVSPASASLIVNGGFETPTANAVDGFSNLDGAPAGQLPGWTIPSGDVDVVNSSFFGPAYEGAQFLDLFGFNAGKVVQEFATTPGQEYSLTFAFGDNPAALGSATGLVELIGNGVILSQLFSHDTSVNGNLDWTLFTGTFIANTSTTTLSFLNSIGGNNGGILLDAVDVNAVPEPSLWATMVAGFGLIGVALRRRYRGAVLKAI